VHDSGCHAKPGLQCEIFEAGFTTAAADDDLYDQEHQIDVLLCQMGNLEFQNLVEAKKVVEHPKWYARAGGIMATVNQQLLKRKGRYRKR
jgi:hypothetical protein